MIHIKEKFCQLLLGTFDPPLILILILAIKLAENCRPIIGRTKKHSKISTFHEVFQRQR